MRDSPIYTVLDAQVQLQKPGEMGASHAAVYAKMSKSKNVFNPFESMQTYSQKFVKPKRTIPKLDGRTYVTRLFPAELRPLLDPTVTAQPTRAAKAKKKLLGDRLDADDDELEKEAEAEEDFIEEELDNDFEEDEGDDEDGKDDYNAEQYFDNGEDDAMDDEGGGEFD